jgi:hypothetical protein
MQYQRFYERRLAEMRAPAGRAAAECATLEAVRGGVGAREAALVVDLTTRGGGGGGGGGLSEILKGIRQGGEGGIARGGGAPLSQQPSAALTGRDAQQKPRILVREALERGVYADVRMLTCAAERAGVRALERGGRRASGAAVAQQVC